MSETPITPTDDAFSDGLDVPVKKVIRPNVFTPVLARMIAAFHANGDKPVEKGAVSYKVPPVDGEETAETCRKTINQIRDTARRMDATVSVKGRPYVAKGAVLFWIVPARSKSEEAADDAAQDAAAQDAAEPVVTPKPAKGK